KLHGLRHTTQDWRVIDGLPSRLGNHSYRVLGNGENFHVPKDTGKGWRNDKSFAGNTMSQLVEEISEKL
uniref:hypothetical protein n=1 Tax=Blastococcus litoris TaxID=2171622 RepID=UPI0019CFFEE4